MLELIYFIALNKEERSCKHFHCTFSFSQQVLFRADLCTSSFHYQYSSWEGEEISLTLADTRFQCAWQLILLSIHIVISVSKTSQFVFFQFLLYFCNHYIVLDIYNVNSKLYFTKMLVIVSKIIISGGDYYQLPLEVNFLFE